MNFLDEIEARRARRDQTRAVIGYLVAMIGAPAVALLGRLVTQGSGFSQAQDSLLVVVVIVAAWLAGRWAGLCATAIGLGTLVQLLVASEGGLSPSAGAQAQLGGFAVAGLFVSLLAGKLHEGRRRIERKHRQLLAQGERSRRILVALRENEERLRLAAEGGGIGIWDADLRTGKAIWSEKQFDLLGYPRMPGGRATVEMWRRCVLPEDLPRVERIRRRARTGHDTFQVEYRIVRADDGRMRWIAAFGRVHADERGEPVRSVGVLMDITDRKQAEEQLQRIGWMLESRPRAPPQPQPYGDMAHINSRRTLADAVSPEVLRDVVGDSLDLLQTSASVYERNGDYAYRSFSSGWCRFLDLASRNLCGTEDNRAAAASGRWHCHESCWQAARLSMERGEPVDMPCRGGIRLYAVPIRAGNVPVGSMTFGYGDPPTDPLQLQAIAERYGVTIEELAARAREYSSRPPFVIEQAKERLRSSARLLGEMAQRRRLEQELQRRLQELSEADRRKDEFLATLSHELRNPLAPIRNALYMLKTAENDPRQVATARRLMSRQVNQMVRLIDDLLDVSRITRNRLELRRERVDLSTVVQQAVESARPAIDAGRHELDLRLPEEPVMLDADPVRLGQVFLNLLNNAARYMEPGGLITVVAERRGDRAVVRVQDTGIGIAPEMLPRVFDAFYQGAPSAGHAREGLGIGLMLAQRLVDLHGGTISAHSEGIGKGTEFVVSLPLAAQSAQAPAAVEPAAVAQESEVRTAVMRRHRVLVVDDNRDSGESLAVLLRLHGSEVRVAYEGRLALEAATWMKPNVVICDIGMPGMSGYEVARRLRQEPWGRSATLIALTGWGQEDDRRRSDEAGFDHHLVKPVDPARLLELLSRVPTDERLPTSLAG